MTFAPVTHPGTPVPEALRSWDADWPGYAPVDITPPELRAAALAEGEAEAWIADTAATPDQVTDWGARREAALMPFNVRGGWPLNPVGRTGRTGRNLGKWGENAAADPIVVAGAGTDRRVLLIRRGDVGQWAVPGGMVDPGETAPAALVRELAEETGVDLSGHTPQILDRTYVPDWRATDHSWVCSTVALYKVPGTVPAVGADDALEARWFPFSGVERLVEDLEAHGGIYTPHTGLLGLAAARLGL